MATSRVLLTILISMALALAACTEDDPTASPCPYEDGVIAMAAACFP